MSRHCCGQVLIGGTWVLYDETPITVRVTPDEGMVSLLLAPSCIREEVAR